jgi:hypothetical protein
VQALMTWADDFGKARLTGRATRWAVRAGFRACGQAHAAQRHRSSDHSIGEEPRGDPCRNLLVGGRPWHASGGSNGPDTFASLAGENSPASTGSPGAR